MFTCRNKYAVIKQIRTDTVELPGKRYDGPIKKAKMIIVLDKGPDFETALKAFNEEKEKRAANEAKEKEAAEAKAKA